MDVWMNEGIIKWMNKWMNEKISVKFENEWMNE